MSRPGRNWIQFLLLVILAMLVILAYTASARAATGLGFPLDDAWIHQTYARNLGQGGEWAFVPGNPSGGSTAPLWTGLLAIGYVLGADPLGWAWAWGAVLLALLGWVSWQWLEARAPALHRRSWLIGVLLVLEWHLAWAGASGMETLAQALVVVLVLFAAERRWAPIMQGLLDRSGRVGSPGRRDPAPARGVVARLRAPEVAPGRGAGRAGGGRRPGALGRALPGLQLALQRGDLAEHLLCQAGRICFAAAAAAWAPARPTVGDGSGWRWGGARTPAS